MSQATISEVGWQCIGSPLRKEPVFPGDALTGCHRGALMVKIGSLSYACDENQELWKELNCFVEAESI